MSVYPKEVPCTYATRFQWYLRLRVPVAYPGDCAKICATNEVVLILVYLVGVLLCALSMAPDQVAYVVLVWICPLGKRYPEAVWCCVLRGPRGHFVQLRREREEWCFHSFFEKCQSSTAARKKGII